MHPIAFFLLFTGGTASQFVALREWNYLNFTWPDGAEIAGYSPENNTLSGINYYDGYYYLSLPRMRDGVPATLVRIPEDSPQKSPLLEPYPSWEMNGMRDCNALQNVQNVEVDSQGRLWIIDGGKTLTLDRVPVTNCTPKLVLHDIRSNKTELVYQFPGNVTDPEFTFLYDLVVDETGGGYAYITDNSRLDPGIIVFSLKQMDSWKIRHAGSMKAQPGAIDLTLGGISINAPINIAGIALGPEGAGGARPVYYSPMSSYHLYSISAKELKNKTNSRGMYKGPVIDYGKRSSQTDSMIVDDADNLYYGLLNSNSIAKWNGSAPFNGTQEVIASSAEFFQWPKAFTFDGKGDLVVLTNKLHKFIMRRMNLSEINFRLMASSVGTNSYIFKKAPGAATQRYVADAESTTVPDNNVYFHRESAQSGGGILSFPVAAVTTVVICVFL